MCYVNWDTSGACMNNVCFNNKSSSFIPLPDMLDR